MSFWALLFVQGIQGLFSTEEHTAEEVPFKAPDRRPGIKQKGFHNQLLFLTDAEAIDSFDVREFFAIFNIASSYLLHFIANT